MTESTRPFEAGMLDFNPKRMTPDEAQAAGIPEDLFAHLGDFRQYPPNIARHFPDGVSWFRAEQPWFFAEVMASDEHVSGLMESDMLILSGSGLSAYKYERGVVSPEYRPALERSERVVRDFLGTGKWVMGICFGGQLAMHAVGGTLGRLPEGTTEAGWLTHQLTGEGMADEVFREVSQFFNAPHFHNDYVAGLPAVGTIVPTASGEIEVIKAEVLAIRRGYKGKGGWTDTKTDYIMASLVEFNNGARLYQIQPHPEMATPEKADFLIRANPWVMEEGEMGRAYFYTSSVPDHEDFSVARVIPGFVEAAKRHREETEGITFIDAIVMQNLFQYLLE